jgi:prepilin signal peptidase PulO-like enzyme (type II secretory pathway)
MALSILIGIIGGWLGGIVVNALADELPYRRNPALPVYPDGTPRPLLAWSGLLAFLLKQRIPATTQPNEARQRIYEGEPQLGIRYLLTEVGTIVVMVITLLGAQNIADITLLQTLFYMLYVVIFMLIIVIDIEHKLILFVVIIPSALLAIVDAILASVPQPSITNALFGGALGFGIFFLLYQGGFLFTYLMGQLRGEKINTVAFGYGDVMMMTLSGLLLGFANTILAMFMTVFLGAIGAFAYIGLRAMLRGRYRMFTALPYGPYIVIATYLMLIFGEPVRRIWLGY